MLKVECVVFFAVMSCLEAAKLPSYIIPCSASDPNLNECGRKHAQDALPSVIKGDPKFKLPSLEPLKLPEIKITSGNLRVDLLNVIIKGFDNAQVKDMQIDLKNKHISLTVFIDKANLLSNYEISGNILILPIRGKGRSNITFAGGSYKYDFDYTLKDKHGDKYMIMKNNKLDFKTERSYFYFENLFGGDNQLGEQMNKFLNENWETVEQELGPAITQTMSTIITSSLNGIFDKVPFKDIILQPNPA
ncbi:hypothetical protein RN001_006413 [Aquatica leii]|uniref:Takeout n=1 Tax=Aquatica leii TaxID=1421715 RepID=A0AAN7SJS6_9COLE|nr:hypothetical protein RN001_006413 [Aquatica leii]